MHDGGSRKVETKKCEIYKDGKNSAGEEEGFACYRGNNVAEIRTRMMHGLRVIFICISSTSVTHRITFIFVDDVACCCLLQLSVAYDLWVTEIVRWLSVLGKMRLQPILNSKYLERPYM